jgi:hypothetical protein
VIARNFISARLVVPADRQICECEDVSRGFSSPEKETAPTAFFITPFVIFSVSPLLLV